MLEVRLELEGSTLAEVRRFVQLTANTDGGCQVYQPDYSVEHPAALAATIPTRESEGWPCHAFGH